jgi:VanZ family protein
MQSRSVTPRFIFWIPAILVAALISIFSTHYFTGDETARVIIPVLHRLFPHASPHTLHLMHVGIRKLAHVVEFGAFSISLFHGIRGPRRGWRWSWAISTLLLAVAYAGLDEWHQTFVPLREPRLRDVAIDSAGALLAQGLVWVYARWKWHIAAPPDGPGGARDELGP